MAFPSNPSDGQIYDNYIYNSTLGVWLENYLSADDITISGGNIGVGTTNPIAKIHSLDSSQPQIRAAYSGDYYTEINTTSINSKRRSDTDGNMVLSMSTTDNSSWSGNGGDIVFQTTSTGKESDLKTNMKLDKNGNLDVSNNIISYNNFGFSTTSLDNETNHSIQIGSVGSYNPSIKIFDSIHSTRPGQMLISMGENSGAYLALGREGGGSDFDQYVKIYQSGSAWFIGNVSVASLTDRTPYPETTQQAWDSIHSMVRVDNYDPNDKENQLDHSKLHEFIQGEGGYRDASATISVLVEVVKNLEERIKKLESN